MFYASINRLMWSAPLLQTHCGIHVKIAEWHHGSTDPKVKSIVNCQWGHFLSDGCMPSSYLDPLHPLLKYSQGSIKVTRFLLVARGPMDIRDTDPKVKNIINCQWGLLDQCCPGTGLVQNYWRMLCAFS